MGELILYVTKCSIADFNIDFKTDIKTFSKIMRNYIGTFNNADMEICISDKDLIFEKEIQEDVDIEYLTTYKLSAYHRKLSDKLPSHEAFVLQSACFDVDGVGVAFAAHSGTGKSTHMRLWQDYLGDKMTIVNGDKPIVRFFEEGENDNKIPPPQAVPLPLGKGGKNSDNPSVSCADSSLYAKEPNIPYAYGTPWNGKEKLGCNMRTPLKHICFIERSETNYVEKIAPKDAIDRIFNQVYMPKDPMAVMKTIELINRLINSCKLWIIHCNMEPEAAEVAYKAIFNS